MRVLDTIKAGAAPLGTKAVDGVQYPAYQPPMHDWAWTPGINRISSQVGTGLGNSAVFACASVIMDAFIEPPWRHERDGEPVDPSDLLGLLEHPNPDVDELALRQYRVLSLHLTGNAYMAKVSRSGRGRVDELWPLMPHQVSPKSSNRSRIVTHYEYRVDGELFILDAADVVHTRYGMDPRNPAAGMSPFAAMLREIYTDLQAARYAAAVLTNVGAVGAVIRPPKDGTATISESTARRLRRKWRDRFSVDNAGTPLVLTENVDIEPFGLTPADMDWSAMRTIPEARIAAVLRVPAILVGLTSGLDMSSGRNETAELMKFFVRSRMVPLWTLDAKQITRQLRADFDLTLADRLVYDLANVWALQEETDKRWQRVTAAVTGGFITVADAQTALGFDPDPAGGYYLQPAGSVPQPYGSDPSLLDAAGET